MHRHKHRNSVGSTLRPTGKNSFFGMGAPLVLPATTFTSSPNTPTVSNPAESALAKTGVVGEEVSNKKLWTTLLLCGVAGALLTYYFVAKSSR